MTRQRVRRRLNVEPVPVEAPLVEAAPAVVESTIDPADACVMPHGDKPAERYMGLLCRKHYGSLIGHLEQIVELYAALPEAEAAGAMHVPAVVAKQSPAPGRIDIMAITDRRARRASDDPDAVYDIWSVLGSWVGVIAYELGAGAIGRALPTERVIGPMCTTGASANHCWHPSCARIRGERVEPVRFTMTELVGTLRRHRQWLAAQPFAPELLNALGLVHHQLATATKAGMWARSIGQCPNCQTRLFNQPNDLGIDQVTCTKCGSSWRGVALARLRLIHEQEGVKA